VVAGGVFGAKPCARAARACALLPSGRDARAVRRPVARRVPEERRRRLRGGRGERVGGPGRGASAARSSRDGSSAFPRVLLGAVSGRFRTTARGFVASGRELFVRSEGEESGQQVTRATGYLPDPEGHKRTSFDHYKRLLSQAPIPLEASLTAFSPIGASGEPEHFDQSQTGSCGGHSTAGSVYTTCAAQGRRLPFVPSPSHNYAIARLLDLVRNPDGTFPKLEDTGSQPNQLIRGMATYGIRAIRALPDRFSDCDPISINDVPMLDEIEESLLTIVVGEYGIFSAGDQLSDDMARAISSGIDLNVAINGSSSDFQAYTSGVLTRAQLAGPLDHDVRCSAYRQNARGKRDFLIWNSWGDRRSGGWGDDGNCWVDETAIQTFGDIYVMTANRG
jgi:hypothetical protein